MMLKQIITITALCTFSLFVQAGKIYKCQDQSGKNPSRAPLAEVKK